MSRTKLPELERKVKIGISINRELNELIDKTTHNKSKFIEELIIKHFKKNK
jgi:hypothetical protein